MFVQPSSTIRIYVEGPAEKVGVSAYSPKEYRTAETNTNEGNFGSLVNVWINGVRKRRFGVHAGNKAQQYIVAEVHSSFFILLQLLIDNAYACAHFFN